MIIDNLDETAIPWRTVYWGGSYKQGKAHAWLQFDDDDLRYPACGMPDARLTFPLPATDRCSKCMERMEHLALAMHETKRVLVYLFPRAVPLSTLQERVVGMRHDAVCEGVLNRLYEQGLIWEYATKQTRRFTARRALREEFGVRFSL